MIRSPVTAEKYALENGDAIVATHTFPTLVACQKFQNQFTPTPKIESSDKQTHTTLEEQAAIERINRRCIANAPSKTLMFLYKVTSFSKACVFFMGFMIRVELHSGTTSRKTILILSKLMLMTYQP